MKKNRETARQLMQKLGYGPDKTLNIKVTTRDWSIYRDPAVLLIDQLKQIYIDGELEMIDTPQYFPKIRRKDYTVALNLQTSGPDPDPVVGLFYGCGSSLNWDGYCNPEIDKLIEQQSRTADAEKPQAAALGDRAQAGGGQRPPDHLLPAWRHLPAPPRQGTDADGQQHLQQLADGRRLDRQVAGTTPSAPIFCCHDRSSPPTRIDDILLGTTMKPLSRAEGQR